MSRSCASQRRIIDDLRRLFPRVQLFLTTHSPFIVQSLRAGEVIPLSGPAHLDKAPFKRSVEEVATEVLGVEDVQRSARFREMQEAADPLIGLLDRTEGRKESRMGRAPTDPFGPDAHRDISPAPCP